MGTASVTACPANRAVAVRVWVFLFVDKATPERRASSSTTICPMLWRVSAYSCPGFPRPTTTALTVTSSWINGRRPARHSRRGRAGRRNTRCLLCGSGLCGSGLCGSVGLVVCCGAGARQRDGDDECVGVERKLGALGEHNLTGGDLVTVVETLNGDLDALGDVGGLGDHLQGG